MHTYRWRLSGATYRCRFSLAQERLWFIDKLQGSIQYHAPWIFRIKGALDVAALEESLQDIVNRHEVLRTVIKESEGIGYQVICNPDQWHVQYIGTDNDDSRLLTSYIDEFVWQPFDLSGDCMLRVGLRELATHEYLLVMVIHHIAADAWSIGILVNELMELYNSRIQERAAVLPSLLRFNKQRDCGVWQRVLSDE